MKLASIQTSMFLQATFFTTAGKRSDAFLPRAIICREKQKKKNQQWGFDKVTFFNHLWEKVQLFIFYSSSFFMLFLPFHLLSPAGMMNEEMGVELQIMNYEYLTADCAVCIAYCSYHLKLPLYYSFSLYLSWQHQLWNQVCYREQASWWSELIKNDACRVERMTLFLKTFHAFVFSPDMQPYLLISEIPKQTLFILTATIRFIASSFRESLLLSSISFKSSCLREEIIESQLIAFFAFFFLFTRTRNSKSLYRGLKQETQTCVPISIQHSKFIKVCQCDPEIILFEVWKPACKMWKTFETAAPKSGVIGKWHNP